MRHFFKGVSVGGGIFPDDGVESTVFDRFGPEIHPKGDHKGLHFSKRCSIFDEFIQMNK